MSGELFLSNTLRNVITGIASIFSISVIGIIGLPLTSWGAIAIGLILLLFGVLYVWKASYPLKIIAVVMSAAALVAINCASLLSSSGTLYVFKCTSLSADCVFPHNFTAFGRNFLAIPVLEQKLALYKFVLQDSTSSYFPRVEKYGPGYVIYAPLEDDATQIFRKRGTSPFFTITVQPKVQSRKASITVDGNKHGFDAFLGIGMPFYLRSRLSNNSPGLFSTITTGDPGVGDWERAIFANELIQQLYSIQPTQILDELEKEFRRTDNTDDFVRWATLSVNLDKEYYNGTTGIGQRTYNIRQFIRVLDEIGGFEIRPDHPWNSAFLDSIFDACANMEREVIGPDKAGVPLEHLHPNEGGDPLTWQPPFASVLQWATKRKAAELAMDNQVDDLGLKQVLEETSRLSASEAISKLWNYNLNQMNESFGAGIAADRVILADQASFPKEAAAWIENGTNSLKGIQIQALSDAIGRRAATTVMDLYPLLISELIGSDSKLEHIEKAKVELNLLSEKLAFLNMVSINLLQKYIIGDELQFNRFWLSLVDTMSDILQHQCAEADVRYMKCAFSTVARLVGFDQSRILNFAMNSEPGKLQVEISKVLKSVLEANSAQRSIEEFDQLLAGVLTTQRHRTGSLTPSEFASVCSSADRFSINLLSRADYERRIILHNVAILFGYVCNRNWVDNHRRVLLDAGLEPDEWVYFVIKSAQEPAYGTGLQ